MIHNIIGNSIKYLDKQRGLINIRIKDVGDFIQVEICLLYTSLGSIKRINILFTENLLENPVSKLFYFGDKKSSIHFHTKSPI